MDATDPTAELERLADASRRHFGASCARIATAGYTVSLDPKHPRRVEALLGSLVTECTAPRVGFVTSPTTRAGSIDRVTSEVALTHGAGLFHLTAREFLRAARPGALRDKALRAQWERVPRFVLPTRAAYSEATAWASDALLVLSGRDASVSDFAFAIARGNRVVLAWDQALAAASWDPRDGRPVDAARYLSEAVDRWAAGQELQVPTPAAVSPAARARWPVRWRDAVLVLPWSDAQDAARRSYAHLTQP